MARPRKFDEDAAVDRAMNLFWKNGYAATSVRDLGEALDLRASSLYASFGDKHSLYLRSLDRYSDSETVAARAQLGAEGPVRDVLEAWLVGTVDSLRDDPDGKGCLMVNAAAELGGCDPEVAARVNAAFDGIRAAVGELLARGLRTGELKPGLDVSQTGALLTTTMIGLRVQGRSGVDRAPMMAAVRASLAVLD